MWREGGKTLYNLCARNNKISIAIYVLSCKLQKWLPPIYHKSILVSYIATLRMFSDVKIIIFTPVSTLSIVDAE